MNNENKILAFCHIIKCSGTTVTSILRRQNGFGHLDALPKPGQELYWENEMSRDFKSFPNIMSISGHCLRPYIDYGEHNRRLFWFTWLRDPLRRLLSGYQHSIEKGGRNIAFENWLQEPRHRNLQVFFLTGSEEDLDGAKDIIVNKMKFVGLVEKFDESLILFKHRLGLDNLNIDYPKPSNTAKKGTVAAEIYSNIDKYAELIDYNISIDRQLYQWFSNEIYPKYVEEYGVNNLEEQSKKVFIRAPIPLREKGRELSINLLRKLIDQPIIRRM